MVLCHIDSTTLTGVWIRWIHNWLVSGIGILNSEFRIRGSGSLGSILILFIIIKDWTKFQRISYIYLVSFNDILTTVSESDNIFLQSQQKYTARIRIWLRNYLASRIRIQIQTSGLRIHKKYLRARNTNIYTDITYYDKKREREDQRNSMML
jgi:hypothetical protein